MKERSPFSPIWLNWETTQERNKMGRPHQKKKSPHKCEKRGKKQCSFSHFHISLLTLSLKPTYLLFCQISSPTEVALFSVGGYHVLVKVAWLWVFWLERRCGRREGGMVGCNIPWWSCSYSSNRSSWQGRRWSVWRIWQLIWFAMVGTWDCGET